MISGDTHSYEFSFFVTDRSTHTNIIYAYIKLY